MQAVTIVIVVALALASIGCNDTPGTRVRRLPLAPTPLSEGPAPAPAPPSILVFTDHVTGFTTSDVREAQDQIVQFNSVAEMIWMEDRSVHKVPLSGTDGGLVVRFGTKDGERRAYLVFDAAWHHYAPPEIVVDLEMVDGRLIITDAKPKVPLPGE